MSTSNICTGHWWVNWWSGSGDRHAGMDSFLLPFMEDRGSGVVGADLHIRVGPLIDLNTQTRHRSSDQRGRPQTARGVPTVRRSFLSGNFCLQLTSSIRSSNQTVDPPVAVRPQTSTRPVCSFSLDKECPHYRLLIIAHIAVNHVRKWMKFKTFLWYWTCFRSKTKTHFNSLMC